MHKVISDKIRLRKAMFAKLKRQKEVTRVRKSRLIAKKFFALDDCIHTVSTPNKQNININNMPILLTIEIK